MSKATAPILRAALLLFYAGVAFAVEPQITANYTETQLRFDIPPKHIESVCGNNLFGIEARSTGDAWVCIAPDAVTGKMDVVNWGLFDSFLDTVVREPTSIDRNFILANDNNFIALDPVTLQQIIIGTLDPPVQTVNFGIIFELMPEGVSEILLDTSTGTQIRTFPGGQLVVSTKSDVVGHFLSPQSTQLVQPGESGFDLYDAHTGQFIKTVSAPQPGYLIGTYDWAGNGLDSIYFSDILGKLSSMNLSTKSAVGAGGAADLPFEGSTPVNWSGNTTDLAGIWYDALRVFNPVTGSILHDEALPTNNGPLNLVKFWPTDYNSTGEQDLLWTTLGGNLYYLPNGGTSRYLQMASGGYQVAGTTGPGFDVLVTADYYVSSDTGRSSYLDIVLREPDTLHEIVRRTDAAAADSEVFLGQFGATSDLVLITADSERIAAERLTDGLPLWDIDNDEYATGNAWEAFAVPPAVCSGAACKRMLIASIGVIDNTPGSFMQVIDTTDGSTLWSSTPDNCVGCGSRLIAFADVNGDGVPDIVRMKPYQGGIPISGTLQVLDGATFQELWSTSFAPDDNSASAVAVATIGTPNIAVWNGSTLQLLAASDGHVITTAKTAEPIEFYTSSLRFVTFSNNEGVWLIMPGTDDIEWLPADLSYGVQRLSVPAVQSIVGGQGGVLWGSGDLPPFAIPSLSSKVLG